MTHDDHVREMVGLPPAHAVPPGVSKLDIDLLCAVARIEQIAREGADSCGGIILDRLINCDAPRLRDHASEAARAWVESF